MAKKITTKANHEPDNMKQDPTTKRHVIRKQVLASLLIFVLLILGTAAVILYGKGYRLGVDAGKPNLAKTGVLAIKSIPEGADVYINGKLATKSNENLNVAPGEYTVKIEKEGYSPWEKKLVVEKEIVTRANALLFPNAPKLEGMTTIGVLNPVIDPTRTKIAYRVASESAKRNGVYVFDMVGAVLPLGNYSRQIADDTVDIFSQSNLAWSPDGLEILASVSGQLRLSNYLLRISGMNSDPNDVTNILSSVELQWEKDREKLEMTRFNRLKKPLKKMITDNFRVLSWSPDDTKLLYVASQSAELPFIIKPRLPGINLLTEDRRIETGKVYVYDIKEDTNNNVLENIPQECEETVDTCRIPITWFSDSNHLIHVHDKQIDIIEYDGSNRTTVYAGPFIDNYVFPWPNGSQLVILTNLNNTIITPNLYTVSLK
jgi:hypothetical protein